jgi:hypothetical protein
VLGDLSCILLQNIALLFIAPSVWQIFRESELIFTAMLTIVHRNQKLKPIDWLDV